MRRFNTAGPVRADEHYCVPSLDRVSLAGVLDLIRSKAYFALYAPRQGITYLSARSRRGKGASPARGDAGGPDPIVRGPAAALTGRPTESEVSLLRGGLR